MIETFLPKQIEWTVEDGVFWFRAKDLGEMLGIKHKNLTNSIVAVPDRHRKSSLIRVLERCFIFPSLVSGYG